MTPNPFRACSVWGFLTMKGGFSVNQAELFQKVLATDQQAQAITQDAKRAQDMLEEDIAAEIQAMTQDYEATAQQELAALAAMEQEACSRQLELLDRRLQEKLHQVDSLYAAKKEEWVDTIVARIVGKEFG